MTPMHCPISVVILVPTGYGIRLDAAIFPILYIWCPASIEILTLICVKKMLAEYDRSYIVQVDTRLEMTGSSGKGHVRDCFTRWNALVVLTTASCPRPNILPADL